MFFIFGINSERKEIGSLGPVICGVCGSYGRYQVYVTYMCLSLFFIPVFKWNRQYYVEMECCGTLFMLNEEKGRQIAAGKDVIILQSDLTPVGVADKRCPQCGTIVDRSFEYCPRCGRKL